MIRIRGDVEQRNDPGNVALAGGSRDGYTIGDLRTTRFAGDAETMQTGSYGRVAHEIGFNRKVGWQVECIGVSDRRRVRAIQLSTWVLL